MKLLTTISSEYVPDWGFYEGVRELVQNMLDSQDKGFRGDIVYLRDKQELIVFNEGTYLTRSNILLGNTTKREDDSQRGKYGEGFKISVLALIRAGKEVVISNAINKEIIKSSIEPHPDYGGINVLCFTTKHDENIIPIDQKKLAFIVRPVSPAEVKEIKHKFLNWDGLELGDYYKTDLGLILKKEKHKGKIYSRGIYVCSIEKLEYGYDINTLDLGRDRNLASQHDICWETSRMWAEVGGRYGNDEQVIKMLSSNAPDLQSINYWMDEKLRTSIFDDFKKSNGEKSYPCSNEWQRKEISSLGYTPVFVSEQHSDIIKRNLPSIDDLKKDAAHKSAGNIDMTKIFCDLLESGWKIKYSPQNCGGKYAWLKPDENLNYSVHGCICHDTPLNV